MPVSRKRLETLNRHIEEGERLLAAQRRHVDAIRGTGRTSAPAQEMLEMLTFALDQLRVRRDELDGAYRPAAIH